MAESVGGLLRYREGQIRTVWLEEGSGEWALLAVDLAHDGRPDPGDMTYMAWWFQSRGVADGALVEVSGTRSGFGSHALILVEAVSKW